MAQPLKTPHRFLFIASIGNMRPYRQTRHSAGHILLDALTPLLPARIPFVSTSPQAGGGPVFHTTWYSPSYMNESGPKLVRQLGRWMGATKTEVLEGVVRRGDVVLDGGYVAESQKVGEVEEARAQESGQQGQGPEQGQGQAQTQGKRQKKRQAQAQAQLPEWQRRGIDPLTLTQFNPTLVILHDELEAPLGKVKVRRGGPETASLRGHRGLISIMESLHGKGLYPPRRAGGANPASAPAPAPGDLAVLRVGVGIGRPETRDRGAVAKFVLEEMDAREMAAVKAAAGPVLDILADELYRGE